MLERRDTGLLVVDIQGKLARLVEGSEALIANTSRLAEGARALGLPVVWLEQNPDKLGATVPELQPQQADALVLPKYSFGALGEADGRRRPGRSRGRPLAGMRHRGPYLRLPERAGASGQRRPGLFGGGCGVIPHRRQPGSRHQPAGGPRRSPHLGGDVPL